MTIKRIANWMNQAEKVFAFTGAGISTESGIPDFRSPGGVWEKYQPVYFDDFMQRQSARREYWHQKCQAHQQFAEAKPNAGHQVLAKWEQRAQLRGVVTQNIDGLHQLAGSRQVLEVHGTAREAACMKCGTRLPIQPFVDQFLLTNDPPTCAACGGPLKHATISFGQPLDTTIWEQAEAWMREADLVLSLGSSLVVYPAAALPEIASNGNARLVIINRDPTPLDALADIVLNQSLGRTLEAIDKELGVPG